MAELEEVKRQLDSVWDYLNKQNLGEVGTQTLDTLEQAIQIVEKLTIPVVSKRLSIKLEDWHYQCGDGCCDMYGTEIALNNKVCDNQYAGDDVQKSLEFVLTELGYEVDIDVC